LETKLDPISRYQTPEGVELSFSLAGPMVRGVAWFLDFIIRIICFMIFSFLANLAGGAGTAVLYIFFFLQEWFYPVVFEVYNGMTPGKKMMNILVVHDDGTPVSWSSSLLRNFIRSVDFLPLFNVAGLISMLLNSRFKRLGDLAAGTVVVYASKKTGFITIPDYQSTPAPIPLKLEEQRLILDFCERAVKLSSERRRELALLLKDMTGDEIPENQLLAFGNWFQKGKTTK
jgi:uncharacterized RDD family membrane protein YckC